VESIDIEASTDRVWIALISAAGFQHWCAVFAPNSYFEGDWSEGSTMRFLARSESGEVGGMVSRVVEHVPHAVIRIEHIGVVKNGID
ncbi:SRPBCC domain-containing protein, partial [Enterococcus faecium]|uniref:SRPBCC family protein n=1 Tax=Enterococcus faecium TaxID=1352 RepID=UPI003F4440CF